MHLRRLAAVTALTLAAALTVWPTPPAAALAQAEETRMAEPQRRPLTDAEAAAQLNAEAAAIEAHNAEQAARNAEQAARNEVIRNNTAQRRQRIIELDAQIHESER